MTRRGPGNVAEEPEPFGRQRPCIDDTVLKASEEFRIKRDALRFRWLIAHPMAVDKLKFKKAHEREAWIDEQMRKNP